MRLVRGCLGVWVAGLFLLTLGNRPRDATAGYYFNWTPFGTQTFGIHGTEILANFLLFMPLGVLMPWLVRRRALATSVVVAFAGSTAIELVQTFTRLGTAGDVTDILLNTAGCFVGCLVVRSFR